MTRQSTHETLYKNWHAKGADMSFRWALADVRTYAIQYRNDKTRSNLRKFLAAFYTYKINKVFFEGNEFLANRYAAKKDFYQEQARSLRMEIRNNIDYLPFDDLLMINELNSPYTEGNTL